MRDTEQAMKAFMKYIEEKNIDPEDPAINDYIQDFIKEYNDNLCKKKAGLRDLTSEEEAIELLQQARESNAVDESIKLLKKAKKLAPHIIEIDIDLAYLSDTAEKQIKALKRLEKKERTRLTNEGYFIQENIGEFYLIFETRGYLRVLYTLAELYYRRRSKTKAIELYKEILRLNLNDNLGCRFDLLPIYADTENEKGMQEIISQYHMHSLAVALLYQIVLYYRLDNLSKAKRLLTDLTLTIPEFSSFIFDTLDFNELDPMMTEGMVQPNSIEEIIMFMENYQDIFTDDLFEWMITNIQIYN